MPESTKDSEYTERDLSLPDFAQSDSPNLRPGEAGPCLVDHSLKACCAGDSASVGKPSFNTPVRRFGDSLLAARIPPAEETV